MQFNSFIFILLFLPLSVLGWHHLNRRSNTAAKLWLIVASIVFYIFPFKNLPFFLAFSIVFNYAASKVIARDSKCGKIVFTVAIAVNVLSLLFYKYAGFLLPAADAGDILLPVGISFFTFQQISYLVMVRKEPEKLAAPMDYLLYVLFFPKLVMGPVCEPSELIPQFTVEGGSFSRDNLASGFKLFSIGLLKKALLADTFAKASSWVLANYTGVSSLDALIGMLSYTFRIYFDFSGYSDMAIGIALMLNIELPMNFDSPYKALSISDFWKRWHITLTAFLTKYVYIPLGGSRRGAARTYLNILLVFLVSGIWHGSGWTFVIWGVVHGLLSIFDRVAEKPMEKLPKAFRWLLTFAAVNFLWLIFASESVQQWASLVGRMFAFDAPSVSSELSLVFSTAETAVISDVLYIFSIRGIDSAVWMALSLLAAFLICLIPENAYRNRGKFTPLGAVASALAFVWGLINLSGETVFVYWQF